MFEIKPAKRHFIKDLEKLSHWAGAGTHSGGMAKVCCGDFSAVENIQYSGIMKNSGQHHQDRVAGDIVEPLQAAQPRTRGRWRVIVIISSVSAQLRSRPSNFELRNTSSVMTMMNTVMIQASAEPYPMRIDSNDLL